MMENLISPFRTLSLYITLSFNFFKPEVEKKDFSFCYFIFIAYSR